MAASIQVTSLTKKYGDFTAVDHLTLSLGQGEVFGLLGPNGAGKSTTILMLLGLTEPTSGQVKVCGLDPVSSPIKVKQKVGYLPEDVGFYGDYSGIENLIYTARLNHVPKSEAPAKARALLEKVGLGNDMDKKVGKYSRGMRQRLGLADVLIKDPEVIILDEPTLGIDPQGIKDFLGLIVELSKEQKITVLFSSHHLHQVQQVCDRVGIFVHGKLLAEGNIEELARSLFDVDNFVIEGEVCEFGPPHRPSPEKMEMLRKGLGNLENVSKTTVDNATFAVESHVDVAPQISKYIIETGLGLNSLHKKVYGLDDIYHRYFQGTDE